MLARFSSSDLLPVLCVLSEEAALNKRKFKPDMLGACWYQLTKGQQKSVCVY